ncbi:tripartite tricarboxylate transporter permease [Thermodesulfobacteriota bacterium]
MEQLTLLLQAFGYILSHLDVLGFILFGAVAGILLGAIPGLTATIGIVLAIPFTFYMSPLAAISMIYAMHKGGVYGGSIPAILFRVPGSPAAACTQIDGYELTKQGKQVKALQCAALASYIGDLMSDMVLIFFTIYLANIALKLGPVELFGVLVFALTIIGGVTGQSMIKGLISAIAGLFVATVGMDPISATARFDFNIVQLTKGFDLIPLLIGVFCMSEVLVQAERKFARGERATMAPRSENPADNRMSWAELKSCLPAIFRSYVWGQIIGVLPGIGAAITPWIGYEEAKRTSKHPEEFGKGALAGVAAPEAANNAVCGANLMPLLTLGIPGSTAAALIMGVFIIHGINPGPRIFIDQAPLVYGIFAAGLLANLTYLLVGLLAATLIGKLLTYIPRSVIYPLVFISCSMGAYAFSTSLYDVGVMFGFGVIGYFMRKYEFSPPAFVIAFMLGSRFEINLRRSLLLSRGNPLIFFTRPVCLAFILLAFGTVGYRIWTNYRKKESEA